MSKTIDWTQVFPSDDGRFEDLTVGMAFILVSDSFHRQALLYFIVVYFRFYHTLRPGRVSIPGEALCTYVLLLPKMVGVEMWMG